MSTPWKPSPLSLVTWPAPFWLASGARDAGRFEKRRWPSQQKNDDDDDDDEDAGRQTTRIYVGRIMRFRESELDFELLESRREEEEEEEDDVLSRCRHHHRRHHHRLLYSPSRYLSKDKTHTHVCRQSVVVARYIPRAKTFYFWNENFLFFQILFLGRHILATLSYYDYYNFSMVSSKHFFLFEGDLGGGRRRDSSV